MDTVETQKDLTSTDENPYVNMFEMFFETVYKKEIERLVENYPDKKSLEIDFKKLEKFDFELADDLIEKPDYVIDAANVAIKKVDVPALELDEFSPHLRFFNLPKDRVPLIRDISAKHLNKMIAVEGIIREITDVFPKLKVATWQCRRCGNTYRIPQEGNQITQPSVCECKHKDFTLVAEKSEFVDFQRIQIQEPLEQIKGNEQPSQLHIYVSDDIVNRVFAGNKTKFSGILRLSEPKKEKKAVYGRYLETIHLEETQKDFADVDITPEEEAEIKTLAQDPKIYDKLIASLAPSIYGHEIVKEAIIMQLFGGVKKNMPDKSTIRGNIHILLIGDPGAAKSMMLLATNKIAPKSIYVAGKTTTGAGIAASAVKDEFGEGGWTLKAGALVLASGGLAAIDEFDKMDANDRSALHEALEQQTVSVAKAGIIARFKTETSVLAAANPKFSRFDPYTPFMEQINLPPTLVSRFDLFFMIRDILDKTRDQEIADHILKSHRLGEMLYRSQKTDTMDLQIIKEIEEMATPPIAPELFSKYISYTRQNVFPVLSDEAIKAITEFYVNLRDMGRKDGSYAATHRQLEGLVRMSEASARVRLSLTVDIEDAERAIRLLKTALQELVTDPETGKIDFDIIATGQSHSKVASMKKILGIIKEKAMEMDMVPVSDVLEEAKTQGIDKDKAMDLLSQLQKEGEIYRPRNNFVRPVQKNT